MYGVGQNVSECFELHLRGSDILNFSGEAFIKPHNYGLVPTVLVFIQYTKMNIYSANHHLFFLRPPLILFNFLLTEV